MRPTGRCGPSLISNRAITVACADSSMASRTLACGWPNSASVDSIVLLARLSANRSAGSPNFGVSFLSASNLLTCAVESNPDPLYSTLVRKGISGT